MLRPNTLAGILLVLLVGACAPVEPDAPAGAEGLSDLLPSLQAYTAGAEVNLVLQVMNTTEEAIELTFPTGQRFDFIVRDGDREIWRWSSDMMFTQAVGSERIEPGESLRYDTAWDPSGGVVDDLTVVGLLTSSDHPVELSTRISFP